jgi:hypothetical protein
MNVARAAAAVGAGLILAAGLPGRILAQAEGAVAGRVLDVRAGLGLPEAQVLVRAVASTWISETC